MDKKYTILIGIILVVNALIALYPALRFDLPTAQTDGATHYALSKAYIEGGMDAVNPPYNKPGSLEEKVSDYPPFTVVTFSFLTRTFGNDTFWINGGYGAIFFIIATLFVYLLFVELTNNKLVGVLGAVFSALNIRAYYTLYAGQYPFFASFCLTIPALYFTVKYIHKEKTADLVATLFTTALVYLTYTPQAAFLTALQIGFALGHIIKQNVRLEMPRITVAWMQKKMNYKLIISLFVPLLIIAAILTKVYLFASSRRSGFGESIIAALLQTGDGYQKAWGYFLVTDGPMIVILGIIGLLYVLYKQNWDIAGLMLTGIAIVSVNLFVIPEGVFARYFIYRFYVTFFILMALCTSIIIAKGLSSRNSRPLFIGILLLAVLFQVGEVSYFAGKVEPAITQDEISVADFLSQHNTVPTLYVDNYSGDATFRDFKWGLIYSKLQNLEFTHEIPAAIDTHFKYIFIRDYNSLSAADKIIFDAEKTAFSSGSVVVKEI